MTWLTLQTQANWLATPDGTNSTFIVSHALTIAGLNERKVALLALIFHLFLMIV
jgi:hypothetical protein